MKGLGLLYFLSLARAQYRETFSVALSSTTTKGLEAGGVVSFAYAPDRYVYMSRLEWKNDVLGEVHAHIQCGQPEDGALVAHLFTLNTTNASSSIIQRGELCSDDVMPTKCGRTVDEVMDNLRDGHAYVVVNGADWAVDPDIVTAYLRGGNETEAMIAFVNNKG